MNAIRKFRRSTVWGLGFSPLAMVIPAAVAVSSPADTPDVAPASGDTLSARQQAVHLLQRATFGVRPQDVDRVLELGARQWLDDQLHPERLDDSDVQRRLEAFPAASMSQRELYDAYPPPRVLRDRFGNPDSVSSEERRQMRMMSPARMAGELVGAKLQRAVYSERQLEEVMVDFWFNHFNVFFAKGADRWLVADYELRAIRPNVFGRFEDLLMATATHPAMLFYLDNWRNFVPDSMNPDAGQAGNLRRQWNALSPQQQREVMQRRGLTEDDVARLQQAARRGGQRGYNENYARELLELHTLGVDGGYAQHDVVEVARALTGWTITPPNRAMRDGAGAIEFRFVPELHDPGGKVVLGHELPGDRSMADGEAVMRILATHPGTARHIATKLVERFVSDDPPEEVVLRVADVFTRTGGDLREVTRAVFEDPGFSDPAVHGEKIRSPFELVAASLRVTEAEVGTAPQLVQQLRSFQHLPYMSDVPTGYPETSDEWVNSGAMLQRMNYALALAGGSIRGVRIDPESVLGGRSLAEVRDDPELMVGAMAGQLLPGADTAELQRVVVDDLQGQDGSGGSDARRAAGLLIGSPEFQRH